MEFGPIWRSLKRNKAGYILIATQIAVTMAIMINSVAIMQQRAQDMGRPSGMDEANIFTFSSTAFVPETDMQSLIEEDLDAVRRLPGVVDVNATNSFPLRQGGSASGFALEPGAGKDSISAAYYFVDEHGLAAFGANLVDGANFAPNEVIWAAEDSDEWPGTAIVSQAFAKALFPEETGSYVGKTMFFDESRPVQIVGVVERLQAPWKGWEDVENAMFVPLKRDAEYQRYVVRTEPGMRDTLMPQVEEMLSQSNKNRIIEDVRTMEDVRTLAYLGDSAMIKMLTFIVTLLLVITGLGIVGLASFNVSRRTRQIGIRRALGATKTQVVRYFQVENFLVSGLGIAAGAVLAVALNLVLVNSFSLRPLAWYVVPVAMLVMWSVGQLAVIGPARRASRVSPAIATRSG
ncbi:MAG TPA: FtsX-like permease family protein [Woeseiaceae bacterium]|nr:FtsX-like permease family protein [Woeseiaceae bacterium]